METGDEKYNKVLEVLRRSEPHLDSAADIERKTISFILARRGNLTLFQDVINLVFGWIYISWIRRTLTVLSVALLIIFIIQQKMLIREVNYLKFETLTNNREELLKPFNGPERSMILFRLSGMKTLREYSVELSDSSGDLRYRQSDIIKMIEKDPQLRKLIEQKLKQDQRNKFNL